MRKEYSSPAMRVETVQVGVFGSYGSDNGCGGNDHSWSNAFGIFNPLFGLCCGGGGA